MLLGASRVHRPSAAAARRARTAALALFLAPSLAAAQQATTGDAESRPRTHTVRRGDTLWDLARRYLNDPFQWPEIYRLNREVVEDPHWIYPGEVLALPGAAPVVAEADPAPAPAPRDAAPSTFAPPTAEAPTVFSGRAAAAAPSGLRPGEILAAPWLGARDAAAGSGRVLSSAELPRGDRDGAEHRQQVQLYEEVLVSLPAGSTGAVGERLLAVEHGEIVTGERRDLGRLVYPLGILEVIRSPAAGEAAVARVTRLLGMVRPGARLVAFDSTVLAAGGPPTIGMGDAGPVTAVRWVWRGQPVPSLQSYLLLEAGERDGVHVGDRFTIFRPRQLSEDTTAPDAPAIDIATVQVVRVTPQGSTAIVTGHRLPAIEVGMKARLTARVP